MTCTDRQKLVAVSPIFLATGLLARPNTEPGLFQAALENGAINVNPSASN
jgi:hypothetical protein